MSVDYYSCKACSETYPDCISRCVHCHEDMGGCGASFCSADCAELKRPGYARAPTWKEVSAMERAAPEEWAALKITCVDCRKENASTENLLAYLLAKFSLTKDQVEAEYLAQGQVKG